MQKKLSVLQSERLQTCIGIVVCLFVVVKTLPKADVLSMESIMKEASEAEKKEEEEEAKRREEEEAKRKEEEEYAAVRNDIE